jgi:RimJ/RimL family protein N-acetyltransferase
MDTTNKDYNSIIWRKGKQVILRPLQKDDLPSLQRWINDPINNAYLSVNCPLHKKGELDWLEQVTKFDPDHIVVAICTHKGELIGNISLNVDIRKQSAVTGTIIGSHHHKGKGYGTDAKMLILDYAFNWLGLRKVTSSIFCFNGASQDYAKKCGYRHMATIEQEHFRQGKWRDEELYVVFHEEWLSYWEVYCSGE